MTVLLERIDQMKYASLYYRRNFSEEPIKMSGQIKHQKSLDVNIAGLHPNLVAR